MRRTVAGLLLTLLLVAGCPSGREDEPPPVPVEIVGAWNMITERGNAFSYEISSRGAYIYVSIMRDGTQQYTTQENGAFVVSDTRITFTPAAITVKRSDTATPSENFERATTAPPRTLEWTATDTELTLTADGNSSVFQRE